MKRIIIGSLGVILSIFQLAAQSVKEMKTEIKHVTVYPDRAQVDQEISVAIPAGKTIFKLTALSPFIDSQSIQVKGSGDFAILSVIHQNNYLQNLEDSPEIKNIRSQIETLQTKTEDEKIAIGILKEKAAFLVANREILVKETTFSIEQLKNVMDLYTKNMEQVAVTSLMKERLIKDYGKQIEALQKQVADRLGKQKLPSGEISVIVTSERQVPGKLIFSYVVSNAGWYPSYDIRVSDINNPVTIIQKANVWQKTGVDWKDVKLSFSNATPWIAGIIPVLYPWFIDFYTPQNNQNMLRAPAPAAAARKSITAEALEIAATEKEEIPGEAVHVPVEKRTGETTVTYDISQPSEVLSDGKIQTVEIQRLNAPAEFKYVTTPKLSPLAYLTANIADWAKLSLQSGEAVLYFDNSFVGKSIVDANQLTDTLTLSLGTDNGIIVKREKRVDFTSKKTIGSNKTETYSFLLTIRNNKPVPVKIIVNDQVPVSSNNGITVDPVELSGGKHNQQTGEIRWDLELNKQEARQIVLTYSVKYPKDKTVILE